MTHRIHDKRLNRSLEAVPVSSSMGNATVVELRSASPTRSLTFGTMGIAPLPDTLKVLTVENADRRRFKGVGTQLLNIAEQVRAERRLPSTTLTCQDERAAEFFFKQGFRFTGPDASAKNAAMQYRVDHPSAELPDDCVFLGDMRKP